MKKKKRLYKFVAILSKWKNFYYYHFCLDFKKAILKFLQVKSKKVFYEFITGNIQ